MLNVCIDLAADGYSDLSDGPLVPTAAGLISALQCLEGLSVHHFSPSQLRPLARFLAWEDRAIAQAFMRLFSTSTHTLRSQTSGIDERYFRSYGHTTRWPLWRDILGRMVSSGRQSGVGVERRYTADPQCPNGAGHLVSHRALGGGHLRSRLSRWPLHCLVLL